jgi:hypothetical protein
MKTATDTRGKLMGLCCFFLAVMPAISLAQNRPQAGDGAAGAAGAGGGMAGGGGGMGGPIAPMLQAIRQLNLPADEMQNVQSVIRQAVEDARDAATGIQQATPQQRIEKMRDLQKIIADAKDKVQGILTPEQKAKYFPLYAKALVKVAVDRLNAVEKASAKLEINDDERSQLKSLFEDDLKSLDGYKTDAEAVTDDAGATDLQQKVGKLTADMRKQLIDILGQDDVQQLMQNMRSGAQSGNRGGRAAAAQATPTTKPAAR